jgi:acyl carrier protein
MDLIEIVIETQEAFDVTIKDDEIEKVSTVNDFVELIESKGGR